MLVTLAFIVLSNSQISPLTILLRILVIDCKVPGEIEWGGEDQTCCEELLLLGGVLMIFYVIFVVCASMGILELVQGVQRNVIDCKVPGEIEWGPNVLWATATGGRFNDLLCYFCCLWFYGHCRVGTGCTCTKKLIKCDLRWSYIQIVKLKVFWATARGRFNDLLCYFWCLWFYVYRTVGIGCPKKLIKCELRWSDIQIVKLKVKIRSFDVQRFGLLLALRSKGPPIQPLNSKFICKSEFFPKFLLNLNHVLITF